MERLKICSEARQVGCVCPFSFNFGLLVPSLVLTCLGVDATSEQIKLPIVAGCSISPCNTNGTSA